MNELQVAYTYCLAHLSHLGERTALRFKGLFPTYESWVELLPAERERLAMTVITSDASKMIVTNFESLIDRALSDVRDHQRQEVQVLSIDSHEYPQLLRQIPNPPLVLFVKGSIVSVSDNSNVAVIGTRETTPTGEKVAFKIAKWLGEHGWLVISGLAKGIDSAAHRGALAANFRTAAVMATPLNKIYPVENKKLANEILDSGGCWISEIPLGKVSNRGSFVQRDRIQSGLSVAVIPVQTDIEGGTMHTVRFAELQERLVLCPRPVEGEQSVKQYAGVRRLIETNRASPFSGEEYDRVLESLVTCRGNLLKTAAEPRGEAASADETAVKKKVAKSKTMGAGKRVDMRVGNLQDGFYFADEPVSEPSLGVEDVVIEKDSQVQSNADHIIPVLYKYYMAMSLARQEFTKYLSDLKDNSCRAEEAAGAAQAGMEFAVSKTGIMMSYWYGMLCVVIEGWRQTGLSDPKIDELLKSQHVRMLWEFRNGYFHFQKKWLPKKQEALLASREAVSWVTALSDAFKDRLLGEMQRINTAGPTRAGEFSKLSLME